MVFCSRSLCKLTLDAAKDGALALESEKAGYTVASNYFSNGARNGFVAFEARSETETSIRFAGPSNGKVVELTQEWKKYELPGSQIFIERYKFFVTLENAGEVEIRNVKVLTEDKSDMVEFEFY